MMRQSLSLLFTLPAVCLPLAAQEITRAETEAFVKEAIDYARAHGKEAAFKEFTRPDGSFRRHGGELYIFVNTMEGKNLAHGQGSRFVNADQSRAKDPDGVEYVQERIHLAKTKGKGWHDYKYLDPKTGKKLQKSSYIEVWDGLIFGAGIYKR
jgi:signal transduction histidine kinase